MRLFRICKERFSAVALSGEGARLYPGRWNEAGVPMVYCATSRALAAMELFVHLDPSVAPDDLVMVEIEAPEGVSIEELEAVTLPPGWRGQDSETAGLGTAWVRAGRSLLLRVPSVVVNGEWNVLINPKHAEFGQARIVSQLPFHYDERMFV